MRLFYGRNTSETQKSILKAFLHDMILKMFIKKYFFKKFSFGSVDSTPHLRKSVVVDHFVFY